MVLLRTWPHIDSVVPEGNWGVGLILPRPNSQSLRMLPPLNSVTYGARKSNLRRRPPPSVLQNLLAGTGEFQIRRKADL